MKAAWFMSREECIKQRDGGGGGGEGERERKYCPVVTFG